jgi:hypothetical protein
MANLTDLARLKPGKTNRMSSWDTSGRNADSWHIAPGETRVLADIKGPGCITHIWMTQGNHYREVLLRFTWDDAPAPSVVVPLGDFFCLGHSIVNSFQSALFSASTNANNKSNAGCALNCYAQMPFKEHALIELINESKEMHNQYFYVDYEIYDDVSQIDGLGYFHAEFHRENPFGGWGNEIPVNSPEADIANKEQLAWENNYVILETKGRGHYIGFNMSITNFQTPTWWGEGDDMIWVDGYKWPPDLHGTGSEDCLNQAWGMQPNAFMHNGSSIYEYNTGGGFQTSYVFHLENPVRFTEEIKVTIEVGHGNHLRNEVSSVAYWYAEVPTAVQLPPQVEQRKPIQKVDGKWVIDPASQITSREIPLNDEMQVMKRRFKAKSFGGYAHATGVLDIDDEGTECLKMHLSAENPELYDVQLVEVLEFFVHKNVTVEIKVGDNEPSVQAGVLMLNDTGKLVIEVPAPDGSGVASETMMRDLVADVVGQEAMVEGMLDFDAMGEDETVKPKQYRITIAVK